MGEKIRLLAEQFGEIRMVKINSSLINPTHARFDTLLDTLEIGKIKYFWMACVDGGVSIYAITNQKYKDELWNITDLSDSDLSKEVIDGDHKNVKGDNEK